MKTQFMLKPLVFALAAVVSAGVYASEGEGEGNGGGHHAPWGGSNATIVDSQDNNYNTVRNEGTVNDASVDGSLGGASGNVGVNVAAGDNNQQANAGAIAVADSKFVFGISANASIDVNQNANNNMLNNYSVPNTAALTNSANGASGNVGINIAAGSFNQQKNDMAIASSETAYSATAGVNVSQTSNNNITNNKAVLDYGTKTVSINMNNVKGTYKGQSDQFGDVYPDIWTGSSHQGGRADGHFDLDTATQGGKDLNGDGGALAFNEAGTLGLSGSATGSIPIVSGFKTAVNNNASVSNSLNGASGNVGVNVAAGGGNQQSNSLAVAAGCTACK